jgi:hypothetical protein
MDMNKKFFKLATGCVILLGHFTALAIPDRHEIFKAAEDGDLPKIREILSIWPRSPNDVSSLDGSYNGMTPFQVAIFFWETDAVRLMLQLGKVNLSKKELCRGDNSLSLAIRCGYLDIIDVILYHLESLCGKSYDETLSPRERRSCALELGSVLDPLNHAEESAFDLLVRLRIINKAKALDRLLWIGLRPRYVPFESSAEYSPDQLLTNPLYILCWKEEWETFSVLARHCPELLFDSIEFPETKPGLRRFGEQSVIVKLLELDILQKCRRACLQYGEHALPFTRLVLGIPSGEVSELSADFLDTLSSDGYSPAEIFFDFALPNLREIPEITSEEILELEAEAEAMGLLRPAHSMEREVDFP